MAPPDELTTLDGEHVVSLARLTQLHDRARATIVRWVREGRIEHVATVDGTRYYRTTVRA